MKKRESGQFFYSAIFPRSVYQNVVGRNGMEVYENIYDKTRYIADESITLRDKRADINPFILTEAAAAGIHSRNILWFDDILLINEKGSQVLKFLYNIQNEKLRSTVICDQNCLCNRISKVFKPDWRKTEDFKQAEEIFKLLCTIGKKFVDTQNGFWIGFHLNDIYITEDGEVFLRVHPLSVLNDRQYSDSLVGMDFMSPEESDEIGAVRKSGRYCQAQRSYCYAVLSLLFYLMIGVYPFDGSLGIELPVDALDYEHPIWLKEYKKIRTFIFDPDNDANRQWFDAAGAEIEAKWKALPAEIQQIFTSTFVYRTADIEQLLKLCVLLSDLKKSGGYE